jgi:hypothetical protein
LGPVIVEVDGSYLAGKIPDELWQPTMRIQFDSECCDLPLDTIRGVFHMNGEEYICVIPWDSITSISSPREGAVIGWTDTDFPNVPEERVVEFDVIDGGLAGEPLPGPRPDLHLVVNEPA